MVRMKPLLASLAVVVLLGAVCVRAEDDERGETRQSDASSASADADAEAAPPLRTDHGVRYRSGGVGKEERDALFLVTKDYTLKVVLAASGDGAFVYDADIRVEDSKGAAVLEASNAGPLFFADLPPGSYVVSATARGATKKQSVVLAKGRQKAISIRW